VRTETDLFGHAGRDWNRLTFTFWQYPADSRLGWHNDAGRGRRGEYIVYLHRQWDISWGGELLLIDREPRALLEAAGASVAELTGAGPQAVLNEVLRSCEISPLAVLPRPNRLVLVKSDTVHTVLRVDRTAGASRRCTLTGFVYDDGALARGSATGRDLVQHSLLGSPGRRAGLPLEVLAGPPARLDLEAGHR